MFWNQARKEKKELVEQRTYDHNERILQGNADKTVEDMYYKRQIDNEKNDLVRWQQDLTEEATTFILDVLGYYKDDDGTIKDNPDITPLANWEFIKRIKPLLRNAGSRNFMMTNYTDVRVRKTLQRAVSKFTDLIFFHSTLFDIDKKDFGYLVETYQELIEPTVFRGYNNGERNFQNSITKRIETFNGRPEEPKKGLFSSG